MTVEGWSDEAVLNICLNLRPEDRAEVTATREDESPYGVFCDLRMQRAAMLWCDVWRCAPDSFDRLGAEAALVAVYHHTPGVAAAVMLSTPVLSPRMAWAAARRVRETVIPAMTGLGLRRVFCRPAAGNLGAVRFLRRCGAEPVAFLAETGKRGEDFLEFEWVASRLADASARRAVA